jgi:hypothetical protein
MNETQPEPRHIATSVSISRKINLGNYESADVFLSVTGIEPGTTREEIDAALATGALAYDALKVALTAKIKDLRATGGEIK